MGEFQDCDVCGRTILRGEQTMEYVDAGGETVRVCALCKPRAETSGWVPAALSGTVSRPAAARRRVRFGAGLRERLARVGQTKPEPEPEPEPIPEPPPPPPPTPLEVFNASEEARKVSGLMRSLGEPRVSVRQPDEATALIVVAWDLSWYRWQVSGEEISELAKGNELSEVPAELREWNASVTDDGAISVG